MSEMGRKQPVSLTVGSIRTGLVRFAVPVFCALFLQVMYTSIDMLIVGNFSSVEHISGVSTGSQLMNTLTALCVGLAMGTTIFIGQKIGEHKEEEVEGIITNSILLFLVMSIISTIIFMVLTDELVAVLNTPKDAIEETTAYVIYCAMGIPLIFFYNVLSSMFRGLGDAKTPLIAVGGACVINIVGDLVLVAGLDMGAAGAAIATVAAQFVSVVVCTYIMMRNKIIRNLDARNTWRMRLDYVKKILGLGIPVALQSVMATFSVLIFTMIVNRHGMIFSAAIGLADKVTGLTVLVPSALMQALSVFVAQNYGAGKNDRAKQGLYTCLRIAATVGAITAISLALFGEVFISIFNREPELVEAAKMYLNGFLLDTFIVTIQFSLIGYFNGYGQTVFVMIQSLLGTFIRIPLVYYMSLIEPVSLFRIGIATPITTSFQILMCTLFLVWFTRGKQKITIQS